MGHVLHLVIETAHTEIEPIYINELLNSHEERTIEKLSSINIDKEPYRFINNEGYPLSSGELSFLRFAAQASLNIENGSLLLLDEPETHLHPNFISQFTALLNQLLTNTGSAAIIATHSAYFVREVFQKQVIILRSDNDGNIISEIPLMRTFGADVGSISYFVFGEDESSKLGTQVEDKLVKEFQTWDSLYHKYKDELSLELLATLKEKMKNKSEKNEENN
tara:strand:+ start:55 stop:717 length:663 start_codon:yes stop_codon:yes gene_type:complete